MRKMRGYPHKTADPVKNGLFSHGHGVLRYSKNFTPTKDGSAVKTKMISALLFGATVVSGCAAPHDTKQPVPPIPAIDGRIAAAVETSAKANQAISQVEVATAAPKRAGPGQTVPPDVVLPPEAIQPVTVDWQGSIEAFLQDMANRAGYAFKVTGRKPANPMMITITANEEPLFGVVRRAGAMAHGYADIGFNPSTHVIEIRYGN